MIPKSNIYYILIAIVIFIVAVNALFFFVSPQEIVSFIGTENAYGIVFITAAIGGLSSITGVALFTTLAMFSAGGADPFLLGLVGGVGIFISDTVFYFVAKYGHKALPEHWGAYVTKALQWIKRYPTWLVFIVVYLYIGFTPLPADVLMATIALAGFPYRKIAPVLLLGSITVAMLVSYVGNIWAI